MIDNIAMKTVTSRGPGSSNHPKDAPKVDAGTLLWEHCKKLGSFAYFYSCIDRLKRKRGVCLLVCLFPLHTP